MRKHPAMELVETLLWQDHLAPDRIRNIIWPDNIEQLTSMQHYYVGEIAPLGIYKNQAQAIFAVTVERASRLQAKANEGSPAMTDYPPTEYTDWQRARGHMSGTIPLRTLEQARADAAAVKKSLTTQERENAQ